MQIQESVTISFERYDRMQEEMKRLQDEVYRLGEWKRDEVEFIYDASDSESLKDCVETFLERNKGKTIRVKLAAR